MKTKWTFSRLFLPVILCIILLSNVRLLLADSTSPLCFTARNGSVTVRFDIKNVSHTIQYSTDSVNWSTYNSNTNVTINANQSVYFRAASNQTVAAAFGGDSLSVCSRFYFASTNGGIVEGSGNIMSLYGPDCLNLPLQRYAFSFLFYNCISLSTAPLLPATSLAASCYSFMFSGCISLTTAPLLPATTLAPNCYGGLFSSCTSLTTAPSLPAMTVANNCYNNMFSDCTSLTTAPSLPAMTVANSCYSSMFSGCTSLMTTPPLPATTLAPDCYGSMFNGCTSLLTIPLLPSTTLSSNCYNFMFNGCTSLVVNTIQPGLPWSIPATTTASYALHNMFTGTGGTMNGTPSEGTAYYIYSAPHFTISVASNDTAMGNVTGGCTLYVSDTTAIIATPNPHYHFEMWSDGDISNPRYVYVTCDSAFSAIFEPNKYNVTSNNYLVSGTGEYEYGSTVTLIAHSAEHERFVQWADGTTDSVHSFVLSSGDTTIIAFYALDSFNIAASCDRGTVTGVGVYAYKDIASIYVEPDKGYRFVEWNDGNGYNPRVFAVEEDLALEAICEEAPEVGVDDVKDNDLQFYVVGNTIYNPANELLRVFSVSGKLLLESDRNIELMGYPVGVYVVVDNRGNSVKVVVQ